MRSRRKRFGGRYERARGSEGQIVTLIRNCTHTCTLKERKEGKGKVKTRRRRIIYDVKEKEKCEIEEVWRNDGREGANEEEE